MREIIQAFRELGHEVETCIMGGEIQENLNIQIESSFLKKLLKKLIPSFFWQSLKDYKLRKFDFFALKTLEEKVKLFQPDLIYERNFYLMKSGIDVAVQNNIPHILEINGPTLQEKLEMEGNSMYLKRAKAIEGEKLNNTSKIAVVSSSLKDHFENLFPSTKGKYLVTPNAIRKDQILEQVESDSTLIKSIGFADSKIIGFVGSILPHHGVDILIKAFAEVNKSINETRLLIIGDGETKSELEELANSILPKKSFLFTGNVNSTKVFDYLSIMDICVMPKSNWYGSPVKVFEYGAMGKPIIAPDRIPLKDVMVHEQDGILTNESVQETVNAVIRLLLDEEFSNTISNNFKQKVMTEHLWVNRANSILSSL